MDEPPIDDALRRLEALLREWDDALKRGDKFALERLTREIEAALHELRGRGIE